MRPRAITSGPSMRTSSGTIAAAAAGRANALGRIYLESGNLQKAEQWYTTGFETSRKIPELPASQAALWEMRRHNALGRIEARRGNRAAATEHAAAVKGLLDTPGSRTSVSSIRICSATSRSSRSSISRPPTSCCAGISRPVRARSDRAVVREAGRSGEGRRSISARCWRCRCTTSIRHSRVRRRGRFCAEPLVDLVEHRRQLGTGLAQACPGLPALARRSTHHARTVSTTAVSRSMAKRPATAMQGQRPPPRTRQSSSAGLPRPRRNDEQPRGVGARADEDLGRGGDVALAASPCRARRPSDGTAPRTATSPAAAIGTSSSAANPSRSANQRPRQATGPSRDDGRGARNAAAAGRSGAAAARSPRSAPGSADAQPLHSLRNRLLPRDAFLRALRPSARRRNRAARRAPPWLRRSPDRPRPAAAASRRRSRRWRGAPPPARPRPPRTGERERPAVEHDRPRSERRLPVEVQADGDQRHGDAAALRA